MSRDLMFLDFPFLMNFKCTLLNAKADIKLSTMTALKNSPNGILNESFFVRMEGFMIKAGGQIE